MSSENNKGRTKEEEIIRGSLNEDGGAKVDPMIRDGVTTLVLAGYSVGHFANDLCASMWFIYLSFYLLNVVKLD